MNITELNAKPALCEFIKDLLTNGFRVYVSGDQTGPKSYCHFTKDNQIGYVQYDYMDGFSLSTVHKPNRRTGTGFQVERDLSHPTIDIAMRCFCLAPGWASRADVASVVKYKDWDDYCKSNDWCDRVEVTL